MNLILTKNQVNTLLEVTYSKGGMVVDDSFSKFFPKLRDIRGKKVRRLLDSYLTDVLGYEHNLKDNELDEIIEELISNSWGYYKIPKVLRSKDVLSNMAYYFAKKIWGLKKLGSLEILKDFDMDESHYIFFDPTLKLSIGTISVEPLQKEDLEGKLKLPKKSYRVVSSEVDSELKGSGYGKEMYYSLIEEFDLLASDRYLYGDSMNIWVNVLPKTYHVYAILRNKNKDFVKITPKSKFPNVDSVIRYVVVKDPSMFRPK